MPIECLSGESFRGQVGNPLEDIVFQVTDVSGAPVKGKHVRITADPPGSVSFGSDRQVVLATKDDGTVAVKMTPRSFGHHAVEASVAGATRPETTAIEVEGFHPEVEVSNMNGRIVALRRQQPQPARESPAWPIVVGLAVLLATVLLWRMIDKPATPSGPIMTQNAGGHSGPAVDATARSDAHKAIGDTQAVAADVSQFKLTTAAELANRPTRVESRAYADDVGRSALRAALLAELEYEDALDDRALAELDEE